MGGNLTIVCRNIEVPTVRHEIVSRSGQGRERDYGEWKGGGVGGPKNKNKPRSEGRRESGAGLENKSRLDGDDGLAKSTCENIN